MIFDLSTPSGGAGLRHYFEDHGYVVVARLIEPTRIDRLLDALQRFKRAGYPYYAQSIHNWISPQIDAHGFMAESIENFTRLLLDAGLARAGREILLGREIHDVLRLLGPGHEHYAQWQDMLFDRSTGTVDHQDSWYLDTQPKGGLIAAWVALEDMREGCGPFHVYPGSHRLIDPQVMSKLAHDDFIARCADYARKLPVQPAMLEKGSVLFWHPSTLHGAARQASPARSRKSLTAHYYPIGALRQRSGHAPPADGHSLARALAVDLGDLRQIADHPIPVGYTRLSQLKFNALGLLRFALNRLQGRYKVSMDMRRKPTS